MTAEGLDAALGAAYLMTDRAFVRLDGDPKKRLVVRLEPKASGAAAEALEELAESFRRELATQKVRWSIARANLPIREHIAEHALRLAAQPETPSAAAPKADDLTEEQKREIDRLIAEVEAEIAQMSAKKAPEAKRIAATWEQAAAEKTEQK